jgi:hypothetical protein
VPEAALAVEAQAGLLTQLLQKRLIHARSLPALPSPHLFWTLPGAETGAG